VLIAYQESFDQFKSYLAHVAIDCNYVFDLPPFVLPKSGSTGLKLDDREDDLTVVIEPDVNEKRKVNAPVEKVEKSKKHAKKIDEKDEKAVVVVENAVVEKPAQEEATVAKDVGEHKHHSKHDKKKETHKHHQQKESHEKAEKEREEAETRAEVERIRKEMEEIELREREERERAEREEREAKEKEVREAQERAKREKEERKKARREKSEREKKEREEKVENERKETEAREREEREAREKHDRESEERANAKREKAERKLEKLERANQEKEAQRENDEKEASVEKIGNGADSKPPPRPHAALPSGVDAEVLKTSSPRKSGEKAKKLKPELIAVQERHEATPEELEKRLADEEMVRRVDEEEKERLAQAEARQARLEREREEYARRQKQRQSMHIALTASKEEEAEINSLLGAYQVAQQGLPKLIDMQREKRAELETQQAQVLAQTPPHMAGQIAFQLHAQKQQLFMTQQSEIQELYPLLNLHEQGQLRQYTQQHTLAYQMEQQQFLQQQQYYQQMQLLQPSPMGTPLQNPRASLQFAQTPVQTISAVVQVPPVRSTPTSPTKLPGKSPNSSSAGSNGSVTGSASEDGSIDSQLRANLLNQLNAITNFLQSPSTPDKVVVIIATTVKSIGRLEKELKEKVVVRVNEDAQMRPVSSQLANKDKVAQIKFLTIRAFDVCLLLISVLFPSSLTLRK
jgi:hypothetical protein